MYKARRDGSRRSSYVFAILHEELSRKKSLKKFEFVPMYANKYRDILEQFVESEEAGDFRL